MRLTQMSRSLCLSALLLLLLSFQTQPLIYPVVSNYNIDDLYPNDPTDFAALASYWTITNPRDPTLSRANYCGTMLMMGGTSLFGSSTILERTYTSLPPHSYISFMLRGVNVNQWSPSDFISIYIDGVLFHTQHPGIDLSPGGQSYCGNLNTDFIWYDTEGVIAHSSSTLSLKYVFFNSGYTTSSYGLYKLAILLRTTVPYYTSRSCMNASPSPLGDCSGIAFNLYYVVGGGTGGCDPSCDNVCFGPGPSGCFACGLGNFFDGVNCQSCHTSCLSCNGPAINQCTLCTSPSILQGDGTCSTISCTGAYVLTNNGGALQQCIYNPCSTSQFIFYNLDNTITCMPTCTSPYSVYNTYFCKLCTVGQYRTYDITGTLFCASICAPPYQTMRNNQYCLLCDLGTYIWYSSPDHFVCLSACLPPYKVFNSIYCVQCFPSEFTYSTPSGQVVCMSACTYPYVTFNSTQCVLPPGNIISTTHTLQLTSTIPTRVLLLTAPGASGLLVWSLLAGMLKYIRYMDIEYSQKLIDLFNAQSLNEMIADHLPTITLRINEQLPDYPLPANFEEYDQQSDFLVNSWVWLLTLAIVIVITLLNALCVSCISKPSLMRTVVTKIKASLQWSYCISTFIENYGELIFYSSLQFLTASYCCNSGWGVASIIVCVCINIIGIALLAKIAAVIWTAQKRRRIVITASASSSSVHLSHTIAATPQAQSQSQSGSIPPHPHHDTYAIVLEDFKPHSLLQQAFFLMYILRIFLFNLFIVYLFAYPVVQGALFIFLTVGMLIYLVAVRPMKKVLDLIFAIVQELILLAVNISVTMLSVLDRRSVTDQNMKTRNGAEDTILWCNVTFFIFALLYSLINLVQQIYALYVKVKERCKSNQVTAFSPSVEAVSVTNNTTKDVNISTITDRLHESQIAMNPARQSSLKQSYSQINTNTDTDLIQFARLPAARFNSSGLSLRKIVSVTDKEMTPDKAENIDDTVRRLSMLTSVLANNAEVMDMSSQNMQSTQRKRGRLNEHVGFEPAAEHQKKLEDSPLIVNNRKRLVENLNMGATGEKHYAFSSYLNPNSKDYKDLNNKNSSDKEGQKGHRRSPMDILNHNLRPKMDENLVEQPKKAVLTNDDDFDLDLPDRRSGRVVDYTTYMEHRFRNDVSEAHESRRKKGWK